MWRTILLLLAVPSWFSLELIAAKTYEYEDKGVLSTMWHAYDPKLFIESMKGTKTLHGIACPSFNEMSEPYEEEFISQLCLWPGLMSDFDRKKGRTVYGSKEALKIIYDHQHPSNCKDAKFLVSEGWKNGGFGSQIHMESVGLAIAMQLGRVFVSHPNDEGDENIVFHNVPFCQSRNVKGYDCYWMSWSNCNLKDAYSAYDNKHENLKKFTFSDFTLEMFSDPELTKKKIKEFESEQSIRLDPSPDWWVFKFSPSILNHLVDCSPMKEHHRQYWWRTISATYFLRPNLIALAEIKTYDTLKFSKSNQLINESISVYIRHGLEKSGEMKFIGFEEYMDVASYMWQNGMVPATNGKNPSFNGTVFLATEDPQVISDGIEWGKVNHWNVEYTDMYDRALQRAGPTGEGVTDERTYIHMMLTVQYAAQCEAWVSTLVSNFIRTFDEVRATVGAKANRFFADISHETCSKPPCIGENLIVFPFRKIL